RLWPVALTFTVVLLGVLVGLQAPAWTYWVLSPLCCAAIGFAAFKDELRKTVVLFYEMEPEFEAAYQRLHSVFEQVLACRRSWHIEARGDVRTLYEWKTSGGASSIVRRRVVSLRHGAPPYFKTNVLVPVIPAGRQTMYFFPDRLLVYAPEGVGAVSYETLGIGWGDCRFIEEDGVPPDARIVDTTWRYVNK